MILAMTVPGWDDLKLSSPPLADRFPTLVDLPPLDPQQTRELIVGHLSSARQREPSNPTYPFSEKLISEIWEESGGNVRKIVELCYRLVEIGVKKQARQLSLSLLEEEPKTK